MSEVYVLVKQVAGRPNGEVTVHGITESEDEAAVWEAANPICFAPCFSTDETPTSDKWESA